MTERAQPVDVRWPDGTPAGVYELDESYAHCQSVVRQWALIDPLAAALHHSRFSRAAAPFYSFARLANTFADAPAYEGRRSAALDAWEEQLSRAYHGDAWHPVFVALADAVRGASIPITLLGDLLLSFRMDIAGRAPATLDALVQHCRSSAGSVGRIVMQLAGEHDPQVLSRAEDLAVGLRMVGLVADLGKDVRNGRIYVPHEDRIAFDVDDEVLFAALPTPSLLELVDFQAARARSWLLRGRPLLRLVAEENRPMVTALLQYAEQRLDEIADGRHDPLRHTH